jgi:hypothetical protein
MFPDPACVGREPPLPSLAADYNTLNLPDSIYADVAVEALDRVLALIAATAKNP